MLLPHIPPLLSKRMPGDIISMLETKSWRKHLLRLHISLACVFSLLAGTMQAASSPDSRLILITTAHSALSLFVGEDGRLYELGYGVTRLEVQLPTKTPPRENEFYPPSGDGFILEPALQATHADGNTSTDLVWQKHDT